MSRPQTGGPAGLPASLKAAREAAGLGSTHAAAARTKLGQTRIWRFEAGKTLPDPDVVRQLLDAYGTSGAERARILQMAEDQAEGARRVIISKRPSTMARIKRRQVQALRVCGFASIGLPGSLQTPAYAGNLMAARSGPTSSATKAAEVRLRGQELLDDVEHPRRWHYIVAEGALSWPFGTPAVMVEQLEHLIAATARPNLRLGVIPFGAWDPRLPLPLNGWEMYDDRHVTAGTVSTTLDLSQPQHVSDYVAMFAKLDDIAVYDESARAVFRQVRDRYRSIAW